MSTSNHAVEAIFFAALEQPDAAQRRAFVAQACADASDLQAEVERLFTVAAEADQFFAKAESQLSEVLAFAPKPKD